MELVVYQGPNSDKLPILGTLNANYESSCAEAKSQPSNGKTAFVGLVSTYPYFIFIAV